MATASHLRFDVYLVNLDPVVGREMKNKTLRNYLPK